jgi:hypothetical protein
MLQTEQLTGEQGQALLRFLGSAPSTRIVVAVPRSHYVRIAGEAAMKLTQSYTLPGGRTVRYAIHCGTVYVADAGPSA